LLFLGIIFDIFSRIIPEIFKKINYEIAMIAKTPTMMKKLHMAYSM